MGVVIPFRRRATLTVPAPDKWVDLMNPAAVLAMLERERPEPHKPAA